VIACDLKSELDIARIGASCDGARPAIDCTVPHASQFVEFSGFGPDDRAAQAFAEPLRERRSARHVTAPCTGRSIRGKDAAHCWLCYGHSSKIIGE
jgi:hypothetical protein